MLLSKDYLDRFAGIGRLYGTAALPLFAKAHVIVIGVGGVGSWAAESLARTGFNHISLVDLDDICVTNINRQLHAVTSTVGQLKVEALAARIRDINPDCQVNPVIEFVTANNLTEILGETPSFVIDCIDSVKTKAALIAHCRRNKIPLISTGAAGGQIDPTQIKIADLNKTINDPLISKVRSLLRREYGFSRNKSRNYSVPCVFSTEQLTYPRADGGVCHTKQALGESTRLDCTSGFGSATMVTASFGMTAAARVAEKIAAGSKQG